MKNLLKHIFLIILSLSNLACSSEKVIDGEEKDNPEAPAQVENELVLTQAQVRAAGVALGRPQVRTVGEQLQVSGRVDVPPQNLVTVHALLPGYVRQMELLPGMHIHQGQTLAMMEMPELLTLNQDYLAARARTTQLQAEAARQAKLATTEATSQKLADLSQADYIQAKTQMQAAAARLRSLGLHPEAYTANTPITSTYKLASPATGTLKTVSVNPGKYITAQDPLFEIQKPGHVHLELSVYERDAARLQVDQPVSFIVAGEQQPRLAHIYLIGKDVRQDRTVGVHCHLSKDEEELLPGTFVSAQVQTTARKAETLPEDAFVFYQNRYFIFTESGTDKTGHTRYHLRPISRGDCQAGFCQVDSLPPGPIVVKGAFTLLSALRNPSEPE